MTDDQENQIPQRKRSLRLRMVVSFLGLAGLPLVLALTALFFLVHNEVGEIRGRELEQEAGQLVGHLKSEFNRYREVAGSAPPSISGPEFGFMQDSLGLYQMGKNGGALLFSAKRSILIGNPNIPIPPTNEIENGWVVFESKGEQYFAGVATLDANENPSHDNLFVAVVQPGSEVFKYLNKVLTQIAIVLGIFGLIITSLSWRIANQFLKPILEIRRGAEIVSRINLSHRIELDTDDELEDLSNEFNHMAENLGKAYNELAERVKEATLTVQEERNRLATVLRTMVDGVVVANSAQEVILMNPRARIILDCGYTSGVGAQLTRLFPADRLNFYLKRLCSKRAHGRDTVEDTVFPFLGGKLLKGSLSTVPGPGGEIAGFLLVFRELSAPSAGGKGFEDTLLKMPQLIKGPVATSRSLIDALQRHKDMSPDKQQAFISALAEEVESLSRHITDMEEATGASGSLRWPTVLSNPRELLEEAAASVADLLVEVELIKDAIPPVLVEPFSWVASLRTVLKWMEEKGKGARKIRANLLLEDGTVVTSFRMEGLSEIDTSELEAIDVSPSGEEPILLGEAVRRNRGELWVRVSGDSIEVRLGLLQAVAVSEISRADGLIEGEPEFYDFDLFLPRPVLEGNILQKNLEELEYVVFDTETTGLNLSQGDKVVSISGVRIRRGRIQNADIFHTFVNPGMPIPPESTAFHQITDQMVADSPSMKEVYPKFLEYLGDSILVAHNAAFDKKCLDLAASATGFPQVDNPILDTLFLSYAIHNDIEGHSLDAIADRLGVVIENRHSSLGDSRATAQVFLGLISLLPGRGVRTLADAKAFCDKYLLLRWQSSRF